MHRSIALLTAVAVLAAGCATTFDLAQQEQLCSETTTDFPAFGECVKAAVAPPAKAVKEGSREARFVAFVDETVARFRAGTIDHGTAMGEYLDGRAKFRREEEEENRRNQAIALGVVAVAAAVAVAAGGGGGETTDSFSSDSNDPAVALAAAMLNDGADTQIGAFGQQPTTVRRDDNSNGFDIRPPMGGMPTRSFGTGDRTQTIMLPGGSTATVTRSGSFVTINRSDGRMQTCSKMGNTISCN